MSLQGVQYMCPPFERAGEVADIFSDLNFGVIEINKGIIELAWVTIIIEGRDNQPALGLLTVAALLPSEWELRLADLNTSSLTGEDWQWAEGRFGAFPWAFSPS